MIGETVMFFLQDGRGERRASACRVLEALLEKASAEVRLGAIENIDRLGALRDLVRFAEPQIGYVDCISFGFMRRHNIRLVLTFDFDFTIAGLTAIPPVPP